MKVKSTANPQTSCLESTWQLAVQNNPTVLIQGGMLQGERKTAEHVLSTSSRNINRGRTPDGRRGRSTPTLYSNPDGQGLQWDWPASSQWGQHQFALWVLLGTVEG